MKIKSKTRNAEDEILNVFTMEIKNCNGNKIKDVLTMDIGKIPMEKIPNQNRKKLFRMKIK